MVKKILKTALVAILTWQAQSVLEKYKPKIVAITGSVGKTSSKDAIYTALSEFYFVRKSEKSFNSEIGAPLTILGRPNAWGSIIGWIQNIIEGFALIFLPNHYPEWLVLEIGADRPGDIRTLASWIKPDIAVITRLSKVPVHVEYFHSVEELVREKSFLVQNVRRDGLLVFNGDDEDVVAFAGLMDVKKIFYGTGVKADVVGSGYKITYEERGGKKEPSGIVFSARIGKKEKQINLKGVLGVQQMYTALAALAVGAGLSLSFERAAGALSKYEAARGRMRVLAGVKGSIIIDDSYNSSPVALEEALRTLGALETSGRKIAVLGDMLELGMYSAEEHKKAGVHAASAAVTLVTVGIRARGIAEGALNAGMDEKNIFQFEDSRSAGKFVETTVAEGDVVLIKGSQGMRMERAVEEVLADPSRKEKLLVRQEREWAKR
ncbi:hypothetical protein EPN83_02335 [Patescibacteria group bacterium]|nr:MAG: hypothetical protein EPN83_02335 [Patescibacteria group bacterium]